MEKLKIENSQLKIPSETKRGFTIIEMLTVTLIMGVLFSIGMRTYYDEKDRFQYNHALTKMMEMIKTARNAATTSRASHVDTNPDPSPSEVNYENVVPTSGYGVSIKLNPAEGEPHFVLFASNGIGLDGDEDELNKKFDDGVLDGLDTIADEILEEFRLPPKMNFEYLYFDDGTGLKRKTDANEIVLFFRPPLGDVYLQGWLTTTGKMEDLEEVGMRFFNREMPETSPKRCQYIKLNRVRAFPSLEYSNCTFDPGVISGVI